MATIFFALFLFMSVLLLLLVVDENNIRRISEQKELNEHMLIDPDAHPGEPDLYGTAPPGP